MANLFQTKEYFKKKINDSVSRSKAYHCLCKICFLPKCCFKKILSKWKMHFNLEY